MCLRKVRSDAVDLLVVIHATCAVAVGNSFWAQREPLPVLHALALPHARARLCQRERPTRRVPAL